MQGVSSVEGTLFLPCEIGSEGYYMKRKLALVLLSTIMVLALAFGLAACGDKPAENFEYEEFETVVKTVLNNSVNKMGEEAEAAAIRATSFNVMPLAFTQEEKDDLFGIIDKYSSEAEIMEKNYVKGMFDLVTQTTMAFPLIAGDALRTYPKVSEFYGVSVGCREEGIYIRVNKDETLYTTSVYTGGGNYSESYYRMEIDYKSETEFSFMIFQDSPANVETNMDAYKMFYYGDSEMNFLNGMVNEEGGIFAYYRNGTDFVLNSAEAAAEMAPLLSAGFEAVDREEIKAISTDTDHIITTEQWADCYTKYMTGGGHFGAQDGQFEIKNGVLYGWVGKEEDCPSVITLPSVNSVYYELRFPAHVKEITIPATVQSVKVERGMLEWLEGGKNEGADKTLVECPLQYFTILLNTQDGSFKTLEKINVASQSPLFASDGAFLRSKDGMLLYVAGAENLVSLEMQGKISRTAVECLAQSDLSRLKVLTIDEQTAEDAVYSVFEGASNAISLDTFNIELSGDSFGGTFGGKVHSIGTVNVTYDNVQSEQAIDFECSVVTLNIVGGRFCRIDTASVIENAVVDFAGSVSLYPSGSKGQIKNIVISEQVEEFNALSTSPMTVTLPYSLYFFKASEKYAGFSDLANTVLEMDWSETDITELKSSVIADGNEFENTYIFAPMTDEEREEWIAISSFRNIHYFTAEESEYGEPYAAITGYWGEESIIKVPETILGYPVYRFELCNTSPHIDLPDPTVDGVTELHLPATLKDFFVLIDNNDGKPQYALEKIVYDGTKEQFQKICSSWDIEAILTFTKIIECTDGVFEIDWSRYKEEGGISVSFIDKNGNEYPASSDGSFSGIYYFKLHVESEDSAQSIALRFDVDIRAFEEENIAVGITVLWAYDPNGGSSRYEFVLGNVETLQ